MGKEMQDPAIPVYTSIQSTDLFLGTRNPSTVPESFVIEGGDLLALDFIPPIIFGDGTNVITTGVKARIPILVPLTITGWVLMANTAGTIVLDIWNRTFASGYPATVAHTIVGGGTKPSLSSDDFAVYSSLASWTVDLPALSSLFLNVDSASGLHQVTFGLYCKRKFS